MNLVSLVCAKSSFSDGRNSRSRCRWGSKWFREVARPDWGMTDVAA